MRGGGEGERKGEGQGWVESDGWGRGKSALNKEWEDYIGLYERALKVKNQIIKTNSKGGGGRGCYLGFRDIFF